VTTTDRAIAGDGADARAGVFDTAATPGLAAEEGAFAAARAICRRHARTFYFCSMFLPIRKREAAYAVYAFCRMLDDAVDDGARGTATDDASDADRHARIDGFLDQLDAIYAGRKSAPANESSVPRLALIAFAQTVFEFQIPKRHFCDLARGCRMDLLMREYATWAQLQEYCHLVAGVVGLILCRIFALEQAALLGHAMQLTNILRDVGQDHRLGRIYLPREDLDRFGYSASDLARGVVDERFRGLMHFEIARARGLYGQAAAGLCRLPADGSRQTAAAMAVIYAGILRAIEGQNYDVFSRRAALGTVQKLARLPRAWRLSRRTDGQAVPEVF
jgi:phytoene synthase